MPRTLGKRVPGRSLVAPRGSAAGERQRHLEDAFAELLDFVSQLPDSKAPCAASVPDAVARVRRRGGMLTTLACPASSPQSRRNPPGSTTRSVSAGCP
eukprot:3221392-Rhodomonas_salina.1